MSATTDAMTQAVTAADAAAQALAQAIATYTAGYRTAASALPSSTPRGAQDVADLEHAVGPERLAGTIAQRLVALGATRVLAQAAGSAAGPESTAWLIAQIEAHVP